MADHYLGIDIGGTRIKWVVANNQVKLLDQGVMDTADTAEGPTKWKTRILELIKTKKTRYQKNADKLHCGLSAPGLVDKDNRMILHMPERLRGIENFNWSEACDQTIAVLNDGHAAALAEYETHYRHKGIQHFLMLTLGTGVGGGIVINGKLYQGFGQRAGHIGHMTLDSEGEQTMTNMPGSLEYTIGNFSIKERTQGTFKSTKELVEAYISGNEKAAEYWLGSIAKLAAGLASLNNILAPEVIVLGGGISAGAGDALLQPLQTYMEKFEWRPGGQKITIQQAKSGAFAGALGAAIFSMKKNNI